MLSRGNLRLASSPPVLAGSGSMNAMSDQPVSRDWVEFADRRGARAVEDGEPTRWFEEIWSAGARDEIEVPWDRDSAYAPVLDFVDATGAGEGRRAVVVGAGLGADAELLAACGYSTVAFDIAPSAVELARRRHPDSAVSYRDRRSPRPARRAHRRVRPGDRGVHGPGHAEGPAARRCRRHPSTARAGRRGARHPVRSTRRRGRRRATVAARPVGDGVLRGRRRPPDPPRHPPTPVTPRRPAALGRGAETLVTAGDPESTWMTPRAVPLGRSQTPDGRHHDNNCCWTASEQPDRSLASI